MPRTSIPKVDAIAESVSAAAIDTITTASPNALSLSLDDLQIAPNVRVTTAVHKRLIESIKAHGVLAPIIVRESVLGGFEVIDGQRRTLAAREAGLTLIPAVITHSINDDSDRIVTQIVVNDEREAVSSWETAQGFKQLSLMGLSVASVAKKTGYSKDVVKAGIEVAAERANAELFTEKQELDLVTAAQIAEFTGDDDAVEQLLKDAGTPQFDHTYARQTKRKTDRELIASETEKWLEQGYLVRTAETAINSLHLGELSATAEGPAITPEEHAQCPGRMVRVDIDWRGTPIVAHYCGAWKTSGHYNRYARNTAGATSGAKSEEAKAERRHTIEMNRAGEAALEVHEKWIHEFFSRPVKAIPSGLGTAAARIMEGLAAASHTEYWVSEVRKFKVDSPTDAKTAERFFFALAVSTVMRHYKREYWRDRHMQGYVIPFLTEISALGYPLADFETDLLAKQVTDAE